MTKEQLNQLIHRREQLMSSVRDDKECLIVLDSLARSTQTLGASGHYLRIACTLVIVELQIANAELQMLCDN